MSSAAFPKDALMKGIMQALEAEQPAPCLVRAEVPIPCMDALAWLHAQRGGEKTYWLDRERSIEMAGIGAAHCVTGAGRLDYAALFAELRAALSHAHAGARYYGGMRFDDLEPADAKWQLFGAHRFVAPRFEVLTQGGESMLACNAYWRGGGTIESELAEVQRSLDALTLPSPPTLIALPGLDSRADSPGREEWERLVGQILDADRRGRTREGRARPSVRISVLRRLGSGQSARPDRRECGRRVSVLFPAERRPGVPRCIARAPLQTDRRQDPERGPRGNTAARRLRTRGCRALRRTPPQRQGSPRASLRNGLHRASLRRAVHGRAKPTMPSRWSNCRVASISSAAMKETSPKAIAMPMFWKPSTPHQP